MDKTITPKKAKLLRLFQCGICHDDVKDARVCPRCPRVFCNKCIQTWMTKTGSCPSCKAVIYDDELIKGCFVDEMHESFTLLLGFREGNLCEQHEQQLSMFCYYCEANICVNCLFATDHEDHKERVVPIDDAYNHYKQSLKTSLIWVKGRREIIHRGLYHVSDVQQQLNADNEQIEDLCDESEQLLNGDASSSAMTKIKNIVGKIAELRSEHQRETEAIRIDRRGDFILEPAIVVFRMPEFNQTTVDVDKYELNSKDSNGVGWKCTVTQWSLDGCAENDEGYFFCYLRLVEGAPGDYSVTFDNQPEKVLGFELNKDMLIGTFDPILEDDTCTVTIEIRQTYVDRIRQLKEKVAQLEKQCDKQKHFRSLLSDYEKIMGSDSD